ncbi:60S ribosomal protein L8, partial [Podila verticillata]
TETFIATEGTYTGQFIYCGKKAALTIGNVLPLGSMPEGTVVCNVEETVGDRGALARTSGDPHQAPLHASTIARDAVPGQKAGLIAARRTGLLRGSKKLKE